MSENPLPSQEFQFYDPERQEVRVVVVHPPKRRYWLHALLFLLTLLIGLTFAVSAKTLEYLVETWLGQEAGGLSGAIAAGLAVLLVTPLNARIQDWAERRFQKDLLMLRRDRTPDRKIDATVARSRHEWSGPR